MSAPYRPARSRRLSDDQRASWQRFLKQAEKAARDPARHGRALDRASVKAGKLPLPASAGHGSDLVALIRIGKAFVTLKAEALTQAVADIARLVPLCRPLFETSDAAPAREVEPRRDIFG